MRITSRRKWGVLLTGLIFAFAITLAASRRYVGPRSGGNKDATNRKDERASAALAPQQPARPQAIGPVDQSVVAGGGGTSSAGNYKVEGTVGQPAAGTVMSGGTFAQAGGFSQAISTGPLGSPSPTPSPTPTPPAVQFSASNYNVGEGDGRVVMTVTRTGDTSGTSTIDFATSNGTASQRTDYIVRNGTLTFASGISSRGFSVPIIDDAYLESNETINLTLSNPVGATINGSTATITITDNDAAGPSLAQKRFGASFGGADETPPNGSLGNGQGYVLLSQSEMTASVSLQFANLGSAETAAHIHGPVPAGTPGPIIFPLPTTNPVTDFQISPSTQQVADLKSGLHYINVHSSNLPNGEIRGQLLWNPTMEDAFFVRQHYLDFLGREPDASGLTFWVNRFNENCVSGVQCFHDNSIGVSDAFFFEPEFHQTAGFVFLAYRAAYGNTQPFHNPDASNPIEANKLPEYGKFTADRARVVGGANLSASQQAFANLLVSRAEFTSMYGSELNTAPLFVDAVVANIHTADNVDLTSERQALIDQFNNAGGGDAGRAQVMYRLALDDALNNPINNRALVNAEYNRQFALTLYFGYLRRNPDMAGFLFWQGQINLAAVGDVPKQQALVCSFVTAGEYEQRFGAGTPRNNRECPQ